jgi:vacuolar-type H+-ATPase subunit E/Vma4
MQTLGSPASVVAAIHEDAGAEVERIESALSAELASIESETATADVAVADRTLRLAAARRGNEDRVARQEWEGRRAAIEQREVWIRAVVARAQELWTTSAPEQLNGLIREARAHMAEGACEVGVNERDRDAVVVSDARVTTASIAGGCIVTIGDVSFDNSFEARSRRLEADWRSALSGMYRL